MDAAAYDFGVAPDVGIDAGQPIFKKIPWFGAKVTLPNGVGLDSGGVHAL